MDKFDELTKLLVAEADSADAGYFHYAHLVACRLPKRLHEQLEQLVNGPVWDGDVICKSDRAELFDFGLAIRVCNKGEQGHTGATYFAYTVNGLIKDIKAGKIAA